MTKMLRTYLSIFNTVIFWFFSTLKVLLYSIEAIIADSVTAANCLNPLTTGVDYIPFLRISSYHTTYQFLNM